MCYEADARPPFPPVSGGAGSGKRITLTAADGKEFGAFSATSDTPRASGVVILPDVRGLHPFYEELADLFGGAGVHATAIDYFGRTAGIGDRGEAFEYAPHVERTTPDAVALDVAAAVEHLRSEAGGGAEDIFTVGFCFGGRASFNQAARRHGLTGVIGFYGRVAPRRADDDDAPISLAPDYECPVLGLFGGADASITPEDRGSFQLALDDAGVPNDLVVYDGAPHSFFDRRFDEHKEACDDAWARVLGFIDANARRGT
jgi:carboxymethylenebutenolidase